MDPHSKHTDDASTSGESGDDVPAKMMKTNETTAIAMMHPQHTEYSTTSQSTRLSENPLGSQLCAEYLGQAQLQQNVLNVSSRQQVNLSVAVEKVNVTGQDMPVFMGPVQQPTFNIHVQSPPKEKDSETSRLNRCEGIKYLQKLLTMFYKNNMSTISRHPADPSERVNIERGFCPLELHLESQKKHKHMGIISGENMVLNRFDTKPISLEDLFNEKKVGSLKVICFGEAGVGKSTLLQKAAYDSAVCSKSRVSTFKLVFRVQLKKMQKTSCVLQAIFDQIAPLNTKLDKQQLKEIIDDNEEHTAILLDGLDEIPGDVLKSPEGVYRVQDILHNRVLVNSFVLVTARPHMVNYVIDGYPNYARVQTLGFTSETINKYIQSYFEDNTDRVKSLIAKLQSIPSLQTLAHIPLITQFLCILWENPSESLPKTLTALFTKFVDALFTRCNENPKQMESVRSNLGHLALDGLLDPRQKTLNFYVHKIQRYGKSTLEDGCRFGFLKKENVTSELEVVEIASFFHTSFQEYFAAYYLTKMVHFDRDNFCRKLEQITPDNIYEMEYFLRFVCGMSSLAAGFILEHIQKMQTHDEIRLHRLARLLLFESRSEELVSKLDPPSRVVTENQEDLIALHNYIRCIPSSQLDICLSTECITAEHLRLLKDILLSGNISSSNVCFSVSKQGREDMQLLVDTLAMMDKRLLSQLRIILCVDENSLCDAACLSAFLPLVSKLVCKFYVILFKRSCSEVLDIVKQMKDCRLYGFLLLRTNIQGHVTDLLPFVTPSLKVLFFDRCGLVDSDISDLINILPAGHGLEWLYLNNKFSLGAVKCLTDHVQGLPKLAELSLQNIGLDEDVVKPLIWNAVTPIAISAREDLTLLKDAILSGNIHADRPMAVQYTLSAEGKGDMQHLLDTLGLIDQGLCDQIMLDVHTNATSHYEVEDLSAFLLQVSKLVWHFWLTMNGRSFHEVTDIVKRMKECNLYGFCLLNINIHGHVTDLLPIVTPFLKELQFHRCGIDDDDIPDLISILPAGHGLMSLGLSSVTFGLHAMKCLTDHVRGLPELNKLSLDNIGLDEDVVKQLIWNAVPSMEIVSREDLTLLKDAVVSGNINSDKPVLFRYTLSAEGKEDMQHLVDTLGLIDRGRRDRIMLDMHFNGTSHCDVEHMSTFLPWISKLVWHFWLTMNGRSCHEVTDIVKRMKECKLRGLSLLNINIHGHVTDLLPIVTPFLKELHFDICGLVDDDVLDLVSILPAGHGLEVLHLNNNAFSLDAVKCLTGHAQGLPKLATLSLHNIGLNEDAVRQVVGLNLPHLKEKDSGVFTTNSQASCLKIISY